MICNLFLDKLIYSKFVNFFKSSDIVDILLFSKLITLRFTKSYIFKSLALNKLSDKSRKLRLVNFEMVLGIDLI